MLSVKETLTKLLTSGAIDLTERKVTWPVTVAANNNNNTNLKTLIDADMPSGYKYVCISGFSTNDVQLIPIAVRYNDSAYSLQVANRSTSSRTSNVEINYICAKMGGVINRLKNIMHTFFAERGCAVC